MGVLTQMGLYANDIYDEKCHLQSIEDQSAGKDDNLQA